jgi:hypothetical protein
MHDASALVSQEDEHEQDLAAGSRHGEEVTRHDVLDMIVKEGVTT